MSNDPNERRAAIRSGFWRLATVGNQQLRDQTAGAQCPSWQWIKSSAWVQLKQTRVLVALGAPLASLGHLSMLIMPETETGVTNGQLVLSSVMIGWFCVTYFLAMPTPPTTCDTPTVRYRRELDINRLRVPAVALGVALCLQALTGPFTLGRSLLLSLSLAVTGAALLALGVLHGWSRLAPTVWLILASIGATGIAVIDYIWALAVLFDSPAASAAVATTATGVLLCACGLGATGSPGGWRIDADPTLEDHGHDLVDIFTSTNEAAAA